MQTQTINFYTDGACSGNPGVGGWACIGIINGDKETLFYRDGNAYNTTNNIMELTAFLTALKLADKQCCGENANSNSAYVFNIYSDSAYIVNCFEQKWYTYWETHNWITKSKQEVKNQDLWKPIMELFHKFEDANNITLNIVKVKGHSDNEFNNLADQYAVAARKELI